MAIGTMKDLMNASQGRMPKKVDPIVPPDASGERLQEYGFTPSYGQMGSYSAAQERRANLARSIYDLMSGGVRPIGSDIQEPTKTYSSLYSQLTRPSAGLSGKGKYGGFYSSQDLTSAIGGTAKRFIEQTPADLRREAMNRYSQLESIYQPERKKAEMALFKGTGDQDYLKKINQWYAENAAPAEEYLASAQQIESSPVSDLAMQIATSVYGMNPDLARGKFSGLNEEYAQEMRDREYMSMYGKPYDIYQKSLADALQAQRTQEEQNTKFYETEIGKITKMNPKTLAGLTGMTVDQVYSTMAGKDENGNDVLYAYKDPNIEGMATSNASGIVNRASQLISSGDYNGAMEILKSINNAPEELRRLITSMLYLSGFKRSELENDLILSGLVTP